MNHPTLDPEFATALRSELVATAVPRRSHVWRWAAGVAAALLVAVSEDVEGARSALGKVFGGELCVGAVEGPTDKALRDAQQALKPPMPDATTTPTTAGAV